MKPSAERKRSICCIWGLSVLAMTNRACRMILAHSSHPTGPIRSHRNKQRETSGSAHSDECGLAASQRPVERNPPQVPREVQAQLSLESAGNELQLSPVELGAGLLECEHNEIAVGSHL